MIITNSLITSRTFRSTCAHLRHSLHYICISLLLVFGYNLFAESSASYALEFTPQIRTTDVRIVIDGNEVNLESIVTENGVLIPLRETLNIIGGSVHWDSQRWQMVVKRGEA